MPIAIILPKFGFTLESAEIVRWLKQDGDPVRSGDPVCEVTTDKVNMEVEAPEDGILIQPLYPEGATVPVAEVIAYLLRPGEARPSSMASAVAAATAQASAVSLAAPSTSVAAASPVARRVAEAQNIDLERLSGSGPKQRIMRRDVEVVLEGKPAQVRATPAARRLARENGIDLSAVSGNGPHGRVQGNDVEAAMKLQRQTAVDTTPAVPTDRAAVPKTVRLEGMRRTIATRLQKSFQTAPHIFFDAQVDASAIETLRLSVKARGGKLSITSVLVKACAWTLLKHPWLNATIDGEEIALWPTANVGVAVALENGLVVPVIQQADTKTLSEIQSMVDDLAERAHNGSLTLKDMVDGTFTISNLGMYGVDRFTAIINPPQAAILAVGRIVRQFVPDVNDQPVVLPLMNLTLSADHRVIDGSQAANFLQDLRAVLEQPALVVW